MATLSFFMYFPLMRPFEKGGVKEGALPKHLTPPLKKIFIFGTTRSSGLWGSLKQVTTEKFPYVTKKVVGSFFRNLQINFFAKIQHIFAIFRFEALCVRHVLAGRRRASDGCQTGVGRELDEFWTGVRQASDRRQTGTDGHRTGVGWASDRRRKGVIQASDRRLMGV